MVLIIAMMLVLFYSGALTTAVPIPFEKREIFTPSWDSKSPQAAKQSSLNGTVEELSKRTDFSDSNWACGGRLELCSTSLIWNGIEYLRGVGDRPGHGAGPGTCARVSCSYNAAIYWCNDDSKGKLLESYGSIADGAERVMVEYIFHKMDWNVIVGKDSC
ncbi:hypothetical protein BDW59DRAFT_173883 [Aspergillus cavernicola]|uniref:Uncharacterized protein n=1 Tax=Aspergillus cavernicola TaxID=176166 RepID=A0ABR4I3P3_9EURO